MRDRRPPIMWDMVETQRAMATIAQRHFEKHNVREGDAITAFLYAIRTKGGVEYSLLFLFITPFGADERFYYNSTVLR